VLDDVAIEIGRNVASLIENGTTIQMGIGQIPDAVLKALANHKDLGVWTEMFSDGVLDLIESGVVNGKNKTIHPGKVSASFSFGSARLYKALHNNPTFTFHPSDYINDPVRVARQHRMVAINSALEVDLTGQVCADSIGTKFFSGIGGQVDFNRGAARSRGGKAIIALPSTAVDGSISRIVSALSPGAGVVTTRGDVHYVVTEFGVAYLHGKSVRERAMALISIAHPDFRGDLLREAERLHYVHMEVGMDDLEGKLVVAPPAFRTTQLLKDGTQVNYRPIHPTDEPRMMELFHALSEEAIYNRFMQTVQSVPRKRIQEFTYIDHRSEVAIVGTVPEAHGEDIIALGAYYLDPRTNRAEVAFVVRDAWQHRGIGTFLNRYLASIARRNGIRGFTAEVLRRNRGMQVVFQNSGLNVSSELVDGVYHFEMDFQ